MRIYQNHFKIEDNEVHITLLISHNCRGSPAHEVGLSTCQVITPHFDVLVPLIKEK